MGNPYEIDNAYIALAVPVGVMAISQIFKRAPETSRRILCPGAARRDRPRQKGGVIVPQSRGNRGLMFTLANGP